MSLLQFKSIISENNKDKPVLVLLHGLFGMSDNLMGIARALSDDFRIVAPDLVNHGRSFHRKSMTYEDMANDVRALLSDLAISEYLVLGHSMGGKVAMQLACDHPETVAKLIVADIAPVSYKPAHLDIFKAMKFVDQQQLKSRSEVDEQLAQYVEEASLRQFFMKNMQRSEDGCWRWRFGLENICNAYDDIRDEPKLSASYTGPTLMVKGQLSDYILPEHREKIVGFFPQVDVKVITETGHWLHAEKPQVFNSIVKRFLLKD